MGGERAWERRYVYDCIADTLKKMKDESLKMKGKEFCL